VTSDPTVRFQATTAGRHPVLVESVTELRGDDPIVATAGDCRTDQQLGLMIAVALSSVDQVDAQLGRPPHQLGDFRPVETPPPLAAELPGA